MHVPDSHYESVCSWERDPANVSTGLLTAHFATIMQKVILIILKAMICSVILDTVACLWKRLNYLRDLSNYMDWAAAICALLFVVPLLLNVKSSWHWQAGALAALASWINLLLYLQRYFTVIKFSKAFLIIHNS